MSEGADLSLESNRPRVDIMAEYVESKKANLDPKSQAILLKMGLHERMLEVEAWEKKQREDAEQRRVEGLPQPLRSLEKARKVTTRTLGELNEGFKDKRDEFILNVIDHPDKSFLIGCAGMTAAVLAMHHAPEIGQAVQQVAQNLPK